MCKSARNGSARFFFLVLYKKRQIVYELRNKPNLAGIRYGDFDPFRLERVACGRFIECPKLITLARHTDLEETTPIHCYMLRTKKKVNFKVPKQQHVERYSGQGLRFIFVHVVSENGLPYWLVVCEANRYGFLVPGHVLNRFGNIVSLKRCRRRLDYRSSRL